MVSFSHVAARPEEVSKVSEEPEVQGLRPQWVDHVLPQAVPFLLLDTQEVESRYARSRSDIAKDTCLLWVTRSITRFCRKLIRKTRQVQHNVFMWKTQLEKKTSQKSWTM